MNFFTNIFSTSKADVEIAWQRLVKNGETCPRCGLTESSVQAATEQLAAALAPRGKTVTLTKKELTLEEFEKNPLRSNEIMINDKTLEDWLGATVGQSQCCGACGDNECRTLELDGKTYEAVPVETIVRAGLAAAESKQSSCKSGCCCGK